MSGHRDHGGPAGETEVVVLVSEELGSSPRWAQGLRVHQQWWKLGDGTLPAESIVSELLNKDPAVVVVADDVPLELGLSVSTLLDRDRADIGVLLLRSPTAEVWQAAAKAGVRDVIDPAAPAAEVEAAVGTMVERYRRLRAEVLALTPADERLRSGRIISVLSPKGGSGKTMLASNLATAMASQGSATVALVDLDCVFGDISSVLGLVPDHTIADVAGSTSLDPTLLKVCLTKHEPSGAWVLAGSGSPEEGEEVTPDLVHQILSLLAADFDYVVVDTAAGLDERALAGIEESTDLVFVASMDVASVRNLGKELEALDRLGMTAPARHFVLNRADARVGLDVQDVESVLSMRVDAALPSSRLVPLSMNQGRPLVVEDPGSAVAQPLVRLAHRLLGVEETVAKRGRFARRR